MFLHTFSRILISYKLYWLLIYKTIIALIYLWIFVKLKLAVYFFRVRFLFLMECIIIWIFVTIFYNIWKISTTFDCDIISLNFCRHRSFKLMLQRCLTILLDLLNLFWAISKFLIINCIFYIVSLDKMFLHTFSRILISFLRIFTFEYIFVFQI